jgi:general secretion pathway protein M
MSGMSTIAQLRTQMHARWHALSGREQRGVSVLVGLIGVCLFWALAIAPARNTLQDTHNRRAHIAQQQAHMLALQAQAQALQTRLPLSRDEALHRLQSLSADPHLQIMAQGERVTVQLKTVPAPLLSNWLTQARSQAQALPVEAHLTRHPGASAAPTSAAEVVWDGTMVLTLPNRGAAP